MEQAETATKQPLRIPEIEAMRMGVNYSFSVRLRDFTCEVRPLANSEITKAYAAVSDALQDVPPHRRNKVTEDTMLAREFLKLASGQFGASHGKITDLVLNNMTNDEIMFVYKEWMAVCDRVNPILEKLPIAKIKELVEEVKKNPPSDLDSQLTELSFGHLVSLAHYLLTKSD
jgi:hypothetical protein